MNNKNLFFWFLFFSLRIASVESSRAQIDSTNANMLSDDSAVFNSNHNPESAGTAAGSITMETWTNITGTSVSSIPVNSPPNSTSSLNQFESPKDVGDNFGRRIRGYIHPPISGNYIFWIASNNTSELWLSTTSLPQNKVKIASVPDWTNYRQWTKYPSQRSVSKYLVAGQKYYIEALHKESSLGDHVSVGWQLPNGTLERPIPGSRLSPYTVTTTTTTTFAFIGDYGSNSTNEAAVANLVKSWQPQFILTAGDNNYPSGAYSTIDVNIGKYYHSYIKPYTGSYGGGGDINRFFPALGNHDLLTSNGAPYLQYFTLPGNERYYDFVKGDVHFFVINSNPSEQNGTSSTSVQGTWLKNKLEASHSKWKIVYFHHSPFCSDNVHGNQSWMQWPFKAWGADAVVSAHAHVYERIIKDNFPYFVNGLGGQSIYGFKEVPVAGSQKRYNQKYGALQVKATSTSLTFRFYNVSYSLIDSYTLVKSAVLKKEHLSIPVISVVGPYELSREEKTILQTLFDSSAVYQWKRDSIIIPGENKNYLVATKPGSYKVKMIKKGSVALSESVIISGEKLVDPLLSADTLSKEADTLHKMDEAYVLKVYPNPNNGTFTIDLNMPIEQDIKIIVNIVNSLGQLVFNKEFATGKKYIQESIELDKSLPAGVYILQVIIGNKSENTNLMLLK